MWAPHLRITPPSESQSWLARVHENFCHLLTSTGLSPSSSNGAPLHVLRLDHSGKARRAQTISFMTHAAVLAALALFAAQVPRNGPLSSVIAMAHQPLLFSAPDDAVSQPSLGRNGGGGDNNPVPATHGFLAPRSSVQLAPPRLPDNANHQLVVPVTILDEHAPPTAPPVSNLGLPWMPADSDSAGPGRQGIGSGKQNGVGDGEGPYEGRGESDGPYKPGVTMPTCDYCPYPVYTDEARHVKVQGTVTLRVLVGADGRASQIRVVSGVGYGLEERAEQTVRGWRFKPALDAARRPVPAWVTIEAIFRLF
jgi:periplasmic protein TonB